MKVKVLLSLLLTLLLLASCTQAPESVETNETVETPEATTEPAEKVKDNPESEEPEEISQEPMDVPPSTIFRWNWSKGEIIDLNEHLPHEEAWFKLADPMAYKNRLLLMTQEPADSTDLLGERTKELFVYYFGMRPDYTLLHTFEEGAFVHSAMEDDAGLYTLELHPSDLIEGGALVKLMLYGEEEQIDVLDEFVVDDKEKLSKFVRSEEGIFFLKNALVFEEGEARFSDGDFVRLRDGEMESFYHFRAAYKDGEVDGKEESFNLSSLCAFENTVAFCTQKEGDSILHLYDGELVSRELEESIDSLVLLKDYGLCSLSTLDSSTNLYTINLETLDFVQQSAELDDAWKWPLQYDEFLSVIYEKESLSQGEEQGVIQALWIDDKGSVKTQEIFRTEPMNPEEIKESFGMVRGSFLIALVEKKGEGGTPEKEWSLVLYPGTK